MNHIELLQDAATGQRTLAYAREDAAAEKFANAQPKCWVPLTYEWAGLSTMFEHFVATWVVGQVDPATADDEIGTVKVMVKPNGCWVVVCVPLAFAKEKLEKNVREANQSGLDHLILPPYLCDKYVDTSRFRKAE